MPLRAQRLAPFLHDVEAARTAPPLTRASLEGTSFAALADSLLVRDAGGWRALMPLEAPVTGGHARDIDVGLVRRTVSVGAPDSVTVLDIKDQADALYSSYLAGAVRLSLAGFAAIVVLLLFTLRGALRVARVVLPLVSFGRIRLEPLRSPSTGFNLLGYRYVDGDIEIAATTAGLLGWVIGLFAGFSLALLIRMAA